MPRTRKIKWPHTNCLKICQANSMHSEIGVHSCTGAMNVSVLYPWMFLGVHVSLEVHGYPLVYGHA